jgi:hypothetical protein
MRLRDLPQEVLDDLSQEDRWRLDIDPGFDSKHEFWMAWRHFLVLPEPTASGAPATEEVLADFLTMHSFDVLLPVPRSHHPFIHCLRLIPSADTRTLTLFLHDAYLQAWFRDARAARYGFLAVADRYEKGGCHFYLASYYHFAYLLQEDYEAAKHIMATTRRDEPR